MNLTTIAVFALLAMMCYPGWDRTDERHSRVAHHDCELHSKQHPDLRGVDLKIAIESR